MDVVGPRRRQSPQAPLFEAGAEAARRSFAAEARPDRLFQQLPLPPRGRRAVFLKAPRQGRCRREAPVAAAECGARSRLPRRASPGRALALAARAFALRRRLGDIAELRLGAVLSGD